MRRVRADVSHQIRPPGPSIFSTRWFRRCLGLGLVLVVALAVGPSVAGWFGADLPGSVFRLSPWGSGDPATAKADPAAAAPIDGEHSQTTGTASVTTPVPPVPARPRAPAVPGVSRASTGSRVAAATAATSGPGGPVGGPPSGSLGPGAAPPPVYWIQAGAFLDHKNAERLAERLRGDGFPATSTLFDQSRVLYRVVVSSENGDSPGEDMIEKVRTLGFTIERGEAGIAATGLVPLRNALEASRRLRDNGIPVQLRQEVGSATYRVVRVGSFPTAREAEDSLGSLQARGVEGFVVREH